VEEDDNDVDMVILPAPTLTKRVAFPIALQLQHLQESGLIPIIDNLTTNMEEKLVKLFASQTILQ